MTTEEFFMIRLASAIRGSPVSVNKSPVASADPSLKDDFGHLHLRAIDEALA